MRRLVSVIVIVGVVFSAGALSAFWFMHHHTAEPLYQDMHKRHHGSGNKSHDSKHNSHVHHHDEVNMPGLKGKDTTSQEVSDLKTIFTSHKGIERYVVDLPNGIKTVTEAEDAQLRDAIISHVSMMVTRLEEGRNPEIIIQTPTLDKLFDVYEQIETEIEMTDSGIAVLQTSSDPDVVRLLQTHAAEVSDMSERGMASVHERMMKEGTSHH